MSEKTTKKDLTLSTEVRAVGLRFDNDDVFLNAPLTLPKNSSERILQDIQILDINFKRINENLLPYYAIIHEKNISDGKTFQLVEFFASEEESFKKAQKDLKMTKIYEFLKSSSSLLIQEVKGDEISIDSKNSLNKVFETINEYLARAKVMNKKFEELIKNIIKIVGDKNKQDELINMTANLFEMAVLEFESDDLEHVEKLVK